MGQAECLEVLEKSNCWISTTEVIKQLGQGNGTIKVSLKKLYEIGEVRRRPMNKPRFEFEWRIL